MNNQSKKLPDLQLVGDSCFADQPPLSKDIYVYQLTANRWLCLIHRTISDELSLEFSYSYFIFLNFNNT